MGKGLLLGKGGGKEVGGMMSGLMMGWMMDGMVGMIMMGDRGGRWGGPRGVSRFLSSLWNLELYFRLLESWAFVVFRSLRTLRVLLNY